MIKVIAYNRAIKYLKKLFKKYDEKLNMHTLKMNYAKTLSTTSIKQYNIQQHQRHQQHQQCRGPTLHCQGLVHQEEACGNI